MRQTEALAILNAGANVFLTGAPGAGKTYASPPRISTAKPFIRGAASAWPPS